MDLTVTPEVQALIDQINADHDALSGCDRLWLWFSMSRATFAVLPRVLMHEMPDDWQKRMAVCLEEYNDAFPGNSIDCIVTKREGNRFVKWPEWLLNYRFPDKDEIERARHRE